MDKIQNNTPWAKLTSINPDISNCTITKNSFVIGRRADSDLALADSRLSNIHCIIFKNKDGEVFVQDNSLNGTYLDDTLIGKGNVKKMLPENKLYVLHENSVKPEEAIGFVFSKIEGKPSSLKKPREESKVEIITITSPTEKKTPEDKIIKFQEELGEEMQCSICCDYFYQCVVVLRCLHNFCGACLSTWLEEKKTCPTCREPIAEVKKNCMIANIVEKFLTTHPSKKRKKEEYLEMDKKNKLKEDKVIEPERPRNRIDLNFGLANPFLTSPFSSFSTISAHFSLNNLIPDILTQRLQSADRLLGNLSGNYFLDRQQAQRPARLFSLHSSPTTLPFFGRENTVFIPRHRSRTRYHSYLDFVTEYREVHRHDWGSDKDTLSSADYDDIREEIRANGIEFSEPEPAEDEMEDPIILSSSREVYTPMDFSNASPSHHPTTEPEEEKQNFVRNLNRLYRDSPSEHFDDDEDEALPSYHHSPVGSIRITPAYDSDCDGDGEEAPEDFEDDYDEGHVSSDNHQIHNHDLRSPLNLDDRLADERPLHVENLSDSLEFRSCPSDRTYDDIF